MIFCEKCFTNPEISSRIKYNFEEEVNKILEKGDCPVCKNSNVHLYNTETRIVLNNIFNPVFEIFLTEDELPKNYPENEKNYFIDIIKGWDLFNPIINEKYVLDIIKNISNEYLKQNPNILSKKVGIIEKMDIGAYSNIALVKTFNWDFFVDELKMKNRFHTNLINEKVLESYCSYLEKRYKKGKIFYRGRIADNKKGFNIEEMNAPPFELAKAGRVNAEGIRHLYLANDEKTTIHEVRAGAYDIITVGKFVLQKDIVIIDFQQLNKINPFDEELNVLDYAINIEHLQKMNREMSKTMRRGDSVLDYIPTQYISDYIKSFLDDNQNPKYSGIEYQSTMNKDGFNMVAFYPDNFKCISVETVSVKDIQYDYNTIAK